MLARRTVETGSLRKSMLWSGLVRSVGGCQERRARQKVLLKRTIWLGASWERQLTKERGSTGGCSAGGCNGIVRLGGPDEETAIFKRFYEGLEPAHASEPNMDTKCHARKGDTKAVLTTLAKAGMKIRWRAS